jgi:hypothetical protein
MREAANRAADVRLQNALLSSHQTHLQTLENAVQMSYAAIIGQISTSANQNAATPPSNAVVLSAISKKLSVHPVTKR